MAAREKYYETVFAACRVGIVLPGRFKWDDIMLDSAFGADQVFAIRSDKRKWLGYMELHRLHRRLGRVSRGRNKMFGHIRHTLDDWQSKHFRRPALLGQIDQSHALRLAALYVIFKCQGLPAELLAYLREQCRGQQSYGQSDPSGIILVNVIRGSWSVTRRP